MGHVLVVITRTTPSCLSAATVKGEGLSSFGFWSPLVPAKVTVPVAGGTRPFWMVHAEQISGPPKFPSGLIVNGNCDRTAGEITPIVERKKQIIRFNPLILEPVSQNRLIS